MADPGIARRLSWTSSPLYALRQHADPGVRLLSVQVLNLQMGLSESKRMELEREWVGDIDDVDARVYFGRQVKPVENGFELEEVWVDGWLLPVHEARRERDCE